MILRDKIAGLRAILKFRNWPELVLLRLVFREDLLIYKFGNNRLIVDHLGGDANGIRDCLTSDMYRRFMQDLPKGRPLRVLDVGANTGGFVILLACEGFAIERGVCVELNPTVCTRLRFNVESNLGALIGVVNAALSNADGSIELALGRGNTGDSIPRASQAGSGIASAVSIRTVTLDTLIEENFGANTIDICKIDIEGMEYDVFAAAGHAAIRRCRFLVMEIHGSDRDRREWLVGRLGALGFRQVRAPRSEIDDVFLFENSSMAVGPDL